MGVIDIEAERDSGIDLLGIELELRRIVGVVSARVDAPPSGGLSLSLAVVGSRSGVAEAALIAVRPYFEGAVDVEVIEVAPPQAREAPEEERPAADRVRLVAVYASPGAPQVEVHLAHGARQAVGRSADRRLIGVARATMGALRALGADVPFEVEVITSLGPGATGPVLVRLSATESGGTRLGVVSARDGHQATVRALLHALNRHLERAFSLENAELAEALAG